MGPDLGMRSTEQLGGTSRGCQARCAGCCGGGEVGRTRIGAGRGHNQGRARARLGVGGERGLNWAWTRRELGSGVVI